MKSVTKLICWTLTAQQKVLVILTINKTAFSNCSEILSATFSAHGVGLSSSKELKRKLETFSIIITVLCVMFMFTNRRFGNSPTVWYAGVGLIISNYPLLSLRTPHIHLKQHRHFKTGFSKVSWLTADLWNRNDEVEELILFSSTVQQYFCVGELSTSCHI